MLVPTFLVVTNERVVGHFVGIEKAKSLLREINAGPRFIAEVDSFGILNRDPHLVGGQNQEAGMAEGFNCQWASQDEIDSLMDICQDYLIPQGRN